MHPTPCPAAGTARSRQLLLPPPGPGGAITTVGQLRRHLQTAIELEHSTIPVYLCALFSIKDGRNPFALRTLHDIVIEEMLHMSQAANILNAVGGEPSVNGHGFVPSYPTYLPHSDDAFLVPLQSFSPQALATFLEIELPRTVHTPPSGDHYHTIGQFYAALKDGLIYLAGRDENLFNGDPARQLGPEHYYGSGGQLVPVRCLDDAIKGINEIVGQGEGIDGGIIDAGGPMPGPDVEYAHYFRFKEIACERRYRPQDKANAPPTGAPIEVDWSADATYQMRPNPKLAHYEPGSPLWNKTLDFNRTYMALLDAIHHAFNGEPGAIARTIPMMWDLKYKALELMKIPLNDSETAGPSFEYISPNLESRS